jgi:hypothetical protein
MTKILNQIIFFFLHQIQNIFFSNIGNQNIFLEKKPERNILPEFNIRLYDKNSESDYFFFLCQNQNIFFSNIANQNNFLEQNYTPPPFKLNGRSLSLSATLILLFSRYVIPRCFNFWTLFFSCHFKVYS